jgi:Ca2+-transporting ATPase
MDPDPRDRSARSIRGARRVSHNSPGCRPRHARSVAFSTLVFSELFRAFAARSTRLVLWQVGAFTNLHLIAVIALSVALQAALGYMPFTQALLGIHALPAAEIAFCLALGLIPVTILEVSKLLRQSKQARPKMIPRHTGKA